ncbi:hypothetical protein EDC01DRAFT_635340 [Geopyxis carbonaria]|nr:hypothetical protein EDC01DRAFT_635340 [Geopyxis carbonaria]
MIAGWKAQHAAEKKIRLAKEHQDKQALIKGLGNGWGIPSVAAKEIIEAPVDKTPPPASPPRARNADTPRPLQLTETRTSRSSDVVGGRWTFVGNGNRWGWGDGGVPGGVRCGGYDRHWAYKWTEPWRGAGGEKKTDGAGEGGWVESDKEEGEDEWWR